MEAGIKILIMLYGNLDGNVYASIKNSQTDLLKGFSVNKVYSFATTASIYFGGITGIPMRRIQAQ